VRFGRGDLDEICGRGCDRRCCPRSARCCVRRCPAVGSTSSGGACPAVNGRRVGGGGSRNVINTNGPNTGERHTPLPPPLPPPHTHCRHPQAAPYKFILCIAGASRCLAASTRQQARSLPTSFFYFAFLFVYFLGCFFVVLELWWSSHGLASRFRNRCNPGDLLASNSQSDRFGPGRCWPLDPCDVRQFWTAMF